MNELDVCEGSWSVGFVTEENFEFFNVVSGGGIDVKDQGLLT